MTNIEVMSLKQSVDASVDMFKILSEGGPSLIPIGIEAVDSILGGMFPGSTGVLAAENGVGKSSIIHTSARKTPAKVGIISTEDTPDVWGTRTLAYETGIDSLRIRRGDISPHERKQLDLVRQKLKDYDKIAIAYAVGSPLETITKAVYTLAEKGCRLIWLDYVQKVRGVRDDRRNEVATVFTMFQEACFRNSAVAMVASQLRKLPDDRRVPNRNDIKETGDIANEARLILMGHKNDTDKRIANFWIEKSTFGGEGVRFSFVRDQSGTFREATGKWTETY